MIPKIIHYCWLSNDSIPSKFHANLEGWKKIYPNFQFKLWNFNTLSEVNFPYMEWTLSAYKLKRYAWASDPIRLFALYKYGGIYMDLDVEAIKSFEPLLKDRYILGREYTGAIEAGVLATEPQQEWIKACLNHYEGKLFSTEDTRLDRLPLPQIMSMCIEETGYELVDRMDESDVIEAGKTLKLFSVEYLSAQDERGRSLSDSRTYTRHHFAASSAETSYYVRRFFIYHLPFVLKIGSIIKQTLLKCLNKY